MANAHNFKAIETIYDGYRFRSRLEARWAVFFDTLGIPYEYEKEGYVLEGISYLPDFWLPEQDCFVEIKGQEPTEEEQNKARLLALYTQKNVSIFYGAIELYQDGFGLTQNSLIYTPPTVWKFKKEEKVVGGPSSTQVEVPTSILALMDRLNEYHLDLFVHRGPPHCDGRAIVAPQQPYYTVDNITDHLIPHMSRQIIGLQKYQSELEELEEEIVKALSLDYGWKLQFEPQERVGFGNDCVLMECERCGAFEITYPSTIVHYCKFKTNRNTDIYGSCRADTPRLLEAYAAARSARFEFGEKGRSHNGRL